MCTLLPENWGIERPGLNVPEKFALGLSYCVECCGRVSSPKQKYLEGKSHANSWRRHPFAVKVPRAGHLLSKRSSGEEEIIAIDLKAMPIQGKEPNKQREFGSKGITAAP